MFLTWLWNQVLKNTLHNHCIDWYKWAEKLIIMVLEGVFKPPKSKSNWRDFKKEEEWELDLEKLIEEGENILNSV
jgi:hypothetical protein